MMKNVQVKHYDEGLIIKQEGVRGMVCIPNILKTSFYETLLTACLNGKSFSWSDLEEDEMTFHYNYKNYFNTFLNGQYVGDLPYVLLNENSVAIPIETNNTFDYFEVYDSRLMETYLLEKEEILK